jgi:hypothetical protein
MGAVPGRSTQSLDVTERTVIDQPPPVLDCARVLEYASVDNSVKFTGRLSLYVDGKALGAVPKLAICQNMAEDPETFLFHCDADWNVLGAGAYPSIEVARARAEDAYAGISQKWLKAPYSLEEAENFVSESWGNHRCAFCGRTPNSVHVLVEGRTGAKICDICIGELRKALREGMPSDV